MSQAVIAAEAPWYRLLNRSQWNTLIASNLGWMFDGYETFALVMAVGAALRQLLEPSQYGQIPVYAGIVIALTLLGWGIGGLVGGVITDYLGRKRTMMLAIVAYSVTTGLSAFAWDWVSFAVLRFLVGLAIESEWVTGTSNRRRAVARQGSRPRRRVDAMRPRRRIFPGLVRLVVRRRHGAQLVALHVPDRGITGLADAVGAPLHPGIRALGTRQRPAPGGCRAQAQRRHARRPGRGAGALHGGRPVRGPGNPQAHRPWLADVARHHVCVLGHLGLDPTLYRRGGRQGRIAKPGMAELCRHGAQWHRRHRLYRLWLPGRCVRPQTGDDCGMSSDRYCRYCCCSGGRRI